MATHSFHYTPHPGQQKFHESTAPTRVLATGARWGKDRCTVIEVIRLCIRLAEHRIKHLQHYESLIPLVHCWIVSPDLPRVRQLWRELKHYVPDQQVVKFNDALMVCELRMGSGRESDIVIEVKSARNEEGLVSVGLDVLAVVEAGFVKDMCWDSFLQPRLMSPGRAGWCILQGTPKGRNWFWREFKRGDPGYHEYDPDVWVHQAPSSENPHIDPEKLAKIRANMTKRAASQELDGEFVGDDDTFFKDPRSCVGPVGPARPPIICSADWGKKADFTVFGALDMAGQLLAFDRFSGLKYTKSLDRWFLFIQRLLHQHNLQPSDIVLAPERNSMGEVIVDFVEDDLLPDRWFPNLRPRERPLIIPFFMSGASKPQCMQLLALVIEQHSIILMDEPVMINELEVFEEEWTPSGHMKLEGPKGIHDDCVDMLAVANWTRLRERVIQGPTVYAAAI